MVHLSRKENKRRRAQSDNKRVIHITHIPMRPQKRILYSIARITCLAVAKSPSESANSICTAVVLTWTPAQNLLASAG